MLSHTRLKHLLKSILLSDLDDTAVHHRVQPLDVRLDWRLLLQKTVKLLIYCETRREIIRLQSILKNRKI